MKYIKIVFCLLTLFINNHLNAVYPGIPVGPLLPFSSTDAPGSFQMVAGSPFPAGSGPGWVTYSPIVQGNIFAAVSNYYANNVTVYTVNTTTGVLTQIPGSPFLTGSTPATVAYTPIVQENVFAAVPNYNDNSLSVYVVNQSTGSLTPVAGSPFSAGPGPYDIAFSPIVQGNLFAGVPNFNGNSASMYLVNQSTGQLTQVPGSPFPTGSAPYGLSLSPVASGNLFAATTNFNDGTITVFLVDQSTGTLTQVPGSPFSTGSGSGSNPIGIAYSPLAFERLFLAVTNSADSTVSIYLVNQATGALTQVPGSPFATGTNPNTVTFSPYVLGYLFAAVANFNDNTVSVYQVNVTTGALTQVPSSPFATGSAPDGVAYSPIIAGKLFSAVANFGDQTTSAYQVTTVSNASPILLAIFNKYC